MRKNLIAYIPTLNQRHLDWFKRYKKSELLLISQAEVEKLLPRLARNMAALPTELVRKIIDSADLVRYVDMFDPHTFPDFGNTWVMPDEDVSHLLAEKYLIPAGCSVEYEMIWARWDMQAVIAEQPVIHDLETSVDDLHHEFMLETERLAQRSPDWWRTIGARIVSGDGKVLADAYNTHMPNEYETYIFGDPRLNVDAGQMGKYVSMHAEDLAITLCAKYGLATKGGKIFVTTFPCEGCARKIAMSGIEVVYFRDGYSSLNAQDVLRTHGVRIVQVRDISGRAS